MSSETSPDLKLVGTVTGGYRVVAPIGSGAMGHVYEAEDVDSSKRVALKVLHKSHQKELAARFLREGKTLALLSHPNIVQLVDMGQLDDETLFLATELVPGGSLRALMDKEGPLDHKRALRIVKQIVDALDAAHGLGVVHRDIKPENVMVGEDDYVKVLDFGVAKLLQDTVAGLGEANLTSVGFSIFGSALYIAPESVTGQPIDARIDLYSTGAVLFEMITGRPVFNSPDPAELLRQHAFEAPPTLQQAAPAQAFAPELEALIARCLAKQPDERYRSAQAMIAALEATLQALDRPIAPVEPRPVVPASMPAGDRRRLETHVVRERKRPRWLIPAGGAVAVLVVVIVLATRGGSDGPPKPVTPDTIEQRERELAGPTKKERAADYLALGHAQLAEGRLQRAVAAYERALRASPALGSDKELRASLVKVLDGKDRLASTVAIELLASLKPPAHEKVVAYASSGAIDDARHRAVMLAEREGLGDKVDRVQSWMLDLQQATTCEDRKAIIEQLAQTADRRALAALKRARSVKCVEQDATNAIARIEAAGQ